MYALFARSRTADDDWINEAMICLNCDLGDLP